MKKNKLRDFRGYFFVFLLIANSGFPFFTNQPLILLGSFVLNLFFIKESLFGYKILRQTLLFILILIVGQSLIFQIFEIKTTIVTFIRWIYPFTTLMLVREKFPKYYVNILYFLTIISFIFYIPSALSSGFQNILHNIAGFFEQQSRQQFYEYNENILIFTVKFDYVANGFEFFLRNPGPFWEAGGFGSYLIIAVIFNTVLEHKLFSKKNIIFYIAILTTWSTGTFLALIVFWFLYGVYIIKKKYYSLLIVPVVVLLGFYTYTDLDFVQERVNRSVVYFENRKYVGDERRDRMVSAIVDVKRFIKYPVFGTGRSFEARFGVKKKTFLEHRNNGLTDFLVKYGLPFFIFYFWNYKKSFVALARNSSISHYKKYGIVVLGAIFFIGFTQALFQQSVFIALFYLNVFYPNKLKRPIYV